MNRGLELSQRQLRVVNSARYVTTGPPYPPCRGKTDQGRRVLEKLRGTSHVEAEFADIVAAVEIARPITMRQVREDT